MLKRARITALALFGAGFAVASLGAYRLSFGALGVVLDTRPAGAALAALALGIGAVVHWRLRGARPSPLQRAIAAAGPIVAVLAGGLILHDMLWVYRTEEIRFSNGELSFSGTLYLPRGATAPGPAVVILHGAGEETRHEGRFYARHFAGKGIAALAYDKRGSGESDGEVASATYEDLAADALAAVEYLRSRPEIDDEMIGLEGTSEGGWVAPIVAASDKSIAFVIVISATAESPAEQVRYEVGEKVKRAGHGADIASDAMNLYARLSRFERTGENREELDRDLQRAARESWFQAAEFLPGTLPPYEEVLQLAWFPAWRSNMDFDAGSHWRKVRCPVLVLLGGRDPKIDSVTGANTIRQALLEGGNRDVTVEVFPEGEHGLVEWYLPGRLPPPRFPRGYPAMTSDWVLRVVGRRPGV